MPPDTDADRGLGARLEALRREQDRLVERLGAGERRFRRLARAVWAVQEAERRRLARELHDSVGQLLTALRQQLELALAEGAEPAAGRVAAALDLATQALGETRELSRLLRPAVLDDLGLEAALRWLARTHQERCGTRVELVARGLEERLPDELETLVFRLVQEALTNAAKHAAATAISVTAERDGATLRLAVADDGRGFDPRLLAGAVGREGLGLRGMADRVELFAGRLEIASRPGEGTAIRAVLPIAADGGAEAEG